MRRGSLKKVVKIVGYPIFFICCFAMFLLWTFPIDRFTPVAESRLASFLERDVDIGEISMSLGGSLTMSMVEIGVPEKEEKVDPFEENDDQEGDAEDAKAAAKKPKLKYMVEEVNIDVGLIDLLFDTLSFELEMDLLGGSLEMAYSGPMPGNEMEKKPGMARRPLPKRKPTKPRPRPGSKNKVSAEEEDAEEEVDDEEDEDDDSLTPLSFSLSVKGISLRQFHDIRSAIDIPVFGTLDMDVTIDSETGMFADANGKIVLNGVGVALGKDKAKIEVGGLPMTLDEIRIDKLISDIEIENGEAKIKTFKVVSKDFDASIDGTIRLDDPISDSRFDLYVMFKFLEAYGKKSPTASMLISGLDDFSSDMKRAHRTDDYYGFRYRGTTRIAKFRPSKTYSGDKKSSRASSRAKDRKKPARPNARNRPARPAESGGTNPRPDPREIRGEDLPPAPKFGHGGDDLKTPDVREVGPLHKEPPEEEAVAEEPSEEEVEEEQPSEEEAVEEEPSEEGSEEGAEEGAEEDGNQEDDGQEEEQEQ